MYNASNHQQNETDILENHEYSVLQLQHTETVSQNYLLAQVCLIYIITYYSLLALSWFQCKHQNFILFPAGFIPILHFFLIETTALQKDPNNILSFF